MASSVYYSGKYQKGRYIQNKSWKNTGHLTWIELSNLSSYWVLFWIWVKKLDFFWFLGKGVTTQHRTSHGEKIYLLVRLQNRKSEIGFKDEELWYVWVSGWGEQKGMGAWNQSQRNKWQRWRIWYQELIKGNDCILFK